MGKPLIERLMDPNCKTVDPHEVARALNEFYDLENPTGLKKLRDSYIIGLQRLYPKRADNKIRSLADENLMFAAGVADLVNSHGREGSYQLYEMPSLNGPVAQFYKKTTGFKPKKRNR